MFQWYSVMEYGAVGNGIADDTAAVQAAIDACALAGGGVVYFPPGTYAVTQITISAQDNGASREDRPTYRARGRRVSLRPRGYRTRGAGP